MTINYRVEAIHMLNYLRYQKRVECAKLYKFNLMFLADDMVSIDASEFDLVSDVETALIFAQKQGVNIREIVKNAVKANGRTIEIPCVDIAGIWAEIDKDECIEEEKRKLGLWLKTATKEQVSEYKRGLALEKAAKIMGTKVKEKKVKSEKKGGDKMLEKQARKIAKMGGKASRYIVESDGIVYVATWAESGKHIEFRKQIAGENPFECEQFPVCIVAVI